MLITGAGRGIGLGLARNLARRGYRLALHYLDGEQEARAAATGCDGVALKADLAIPGEAARLVESAVESLGRLDAVINNAGVDYGPCSFLEMSPTDYARLRAVNLDAVFEASQAAAKAMVRLGIRGRLIQSAPSIPG